VILIDFGKTPSIRGTTANEIGEWTAGFVIDIQAYGNTIISAKGEKAGTGTSSFTILPELIQVEPASGTIGTPVVVKGQGYAASETVSIRFGNNMEPIIEVMTDNLGIFTTVFVVDTQSYGTCTINAIGTISSSSNNYFFVMPQFYGVTPISGTIGVPITIRGNGYKANDLIAIDFGTTVEILKNNLAEPNGTFVLSFTANTQVFGTCTIVAKGIYSSSASNIFLIVPQIYSITPTIGTVGTVVGLSGNGYIGNEVIKIGFGQIESIATMQANVFGQFSNTFTIGAQPYGTTTVTATGLMSQNQANIRFRVTQQIVSISPQAGTIGTTVTVIGNGYGLSATVRIDLGSTQSIALVISNVNGMFTAIFTVDLQVGTKSVTATGLSTGAVSSIAFKVKPNIYLITPTQGTVGAIVTLNGNGYSALGNIYIDFGTTKTIMSFSASNGGTFTRSLTIDTQGYGTTTVTAREDNDEAIRTVMIRGKMTLFTPTNGTVGVFVTISGTGYGSSETIRVSMGTTVTLATVQSTASGTFTISFTTDNQPYGTNTVSAYGVSSTENIGAGFAIAPRVYFVYPIAGPTDATVEVKGNGYGKSEPIKVDFGVNPGIVSVSADVTGSFVAQFNVTSQPGGMATITATGMRTGATAAYDIRFTVKPGIVSMSPTRGTIGTIIKVLGSNYNSSATIQIDFGASKSIAIQQADGNGAFDISFTVDTQVSGWQTVVATNVGSSSQTDWRGFILIGRIVTSSPTMGTVGTVVSIAGDGYGASETIRVDVGVTTGIKAISDTSKGVFSGTFTIDAQVYGTTTITAVGLTSGQSTISTFFVTPRIRTVTPTTGTVGTQVSIIGDGYEATDFIWINFGTTKSISYATTDRLGVFNAVWTVNTQVYGTTTIKAIDIVSSEATFFVKPQVYNASPTSGTVGTIVTVAGSGYAASNSINIAFGINSSITTTTADNSGWFSTTFTVDTQQYGTTTITASGVSIAANVFRILPEVYSMIPPAGTVGTIVIIAGTGYTASEAIIISFGSNLTIQQVTASQSGSWTVAWTVDTQIYGSTTIMATGAGKSANRQFKILPGILMMTPTRGSVGTQISMIGAGYGSNEVVTFGIGWSPVLGSLTSTANGSFSVSFTVDVQPYGTRTVGATSPIAGTATMKFFVNAQITNVWPKFSPPGGTVGVLATVEGNGYLPGETVRIDFGWTGTITTTTADQYGMFLAKFTVDTQPYGTTTIKAIGLISEATAEAYFGINTNITNITPNKGIVGTIVTLKGNGYAAFEQVRIDLGKTKTIFWVASNNKGEFEGSFTVDTQAYGVLTVVAEGTGSCKPAYSMFTIETKVTSVLPSVGTVGTVVTISGTGYADSDVITVAFGTNGSVLTTNASAFGSFSTIFTVDTQKYGTTTIIAGSP
ncbi:hypothetical protein COZ71_08540, partial [Candidatus Desantisbacteria bacterium CG_4_8_14_3_um_filter_40_12]